MYGLIYAMKLIRLLFVPSLRELFSAMTLVRTMSMLALMLDDNALSAL